MTDFVSEISFYPPSSAGVPAIVAVGDFIICKTNGRPATTIEWQDTMFISAFYFCLKIIEVQIVHRQTGFCKITLSLNHKFFSYGKWVLLWDGVVHWLEYYGEYGFDLSMRLLCRNFQTSISIAIAWSLNSGALIKLI